MPEKERRARREGATEGEVVTDLPAIIEPGVVPEIPMPDLDYFLDVPEDWTYEQWASKAPEIKAMVLRVQSGHGALDKVNDSMMFRVGDYLLAGSERYEGYSQLMDDSENEGQTFGYSISTLKQAMWVCKQIPKKQREPRLNYRHHMLCAGMEAEERKRWFKRAMAENLSAQEMRRQIRGITGGAEEEEAAKGTKKKREVSIKPLQLNYKGLNDFNTAIADLGDAVCDERDLLQKDNNHEIQLDLIEKYAKKLSIELARLFLAIKDEVGKQAA